ncbi:MAG TPA: GAF domain-containing protein, partial [Methylomirabilota bacterium]|nr:GAF domain-containing protein [Methylomirabilota bacterium]
LQAGAVLPPGAGVSGLAVVKGEPVFSADIMNDPEVVLTERHQFLAVLGSRTALAAPLRSKGKIIGALSIFDQVGRVFTESEVLLLQRFADQAALALENARLFEETERRRREAEELAQVARTLTESLDVEAVSERIVESVRRFFGVESALVFQLQPDQSLRSLAITGVVGQVVPGLTFPPGAGVAGLAVATGEPVFSADVMNDPQIVVTEAHRHLAVMESKAVLGVPLRSKGKIIGALTITDHPGRTFSEAEVTLLRTYADHAALALENAHLYRAGQHRERIARSLYEIGKAISSTLDPTTLLAQIGEKAIEVIGASTCAVFEINEADQQLYVRATKGISPDHRFAPIKLGQGPAGSAAAQRRTVFTSDIVARPLPGSDEIVDDTGMPVPHVTPSGEYHAVLAAPLISQDTVIGAICVYWDQAHAHQDDEAEVLSSFADQAAIALRNAGLFQEATRSYEELKRTQDQMIHIEKLRALGEMAGGVAHDFNNLLAAILGRAQYALLCMGELSEHDIRRCLTVIEQAALDGAETVRRLLDFTRGKPRQQELTSVDVNELLSYITEASRPRWKDEAEAKGVTIQVNCLRGEVVPIAGNPVELREVLLNFVFNAIEAMPQGGALTLRSFMEGGKVCIQLEDTGHGMPEEVRRRIFDPFFTTKGPQRSGLGLSVSYGIIRRHEGEIEVESREGKGTTFTIRLPVREAPAPPIRVSEAISTGSFRLLVVDDEAPVRETLEEILQAAGHQVVTAEDGFQALDLLRRQTFDFVCTDLGMPGMNGWELVQRVKAEWPAVKIALITGWGAQVESEDVMASGVDLLIAKPFEIREILRALAMAAGQTSATQR